MLRETSLPEDTTCTPWSLQKTVTQLVQQQWWNELPKERQDELDRRCRTAGDLKRTKKSYFKACTRQHFGGTEWFYCVIALGVALPAEIIVALNPGSAGEPRPKAELKLKEKQYEKMTAAYSRGQWVDGREYNR